MQGLARTS